MTDGRIHPAARGYAAAVEHYGRGRPTYPDDAVTYLVEALGISQESDVLELGAGTGRFTELMVYSGARITAVEPVAEMRAALERACPTVLVLDATAEAIPLPDGSFDVVVAAQAFHWFDGDRALPEIHRVLRAGGMLGLIWSLRDDASDWAERLTTILDRAAGDTPRYRTGAWRGAFERTDLFGPLHHRVAYHVHHVAPDAFVDRALSVGFRASASDEDRRRLEDEIRHLIADEPELRDRDEIVMPYRTDVFWTHKH